MGFNYCQYDIGVVIKAFQPNSLRVSEKFGYMANSEARSVKYRGTWNHDLCDVILV